jgi:anti-sigma factor RsiW
MSETFLCDDKEQLVAYLYDEIDGISRRRIDDHLRVCPACAAEVQGLSGLRRELAQWTPPDAELGFTIVQSGAPPVQSGTPPPAVAPPPGGRRWTSARVPAWAQAAAAVLVLAAGLSIANLQIRYGDDGLVITTGWMAPSPGAPAPAAAAASPSGAEWQPAMAALESTLRAEIRATRSSGAAPASAAPSRSNDLSVQRVTNLIEQSERRQKQELALRLAQFGRDLEVQRRSDLVRINQGFGQFEGRAGAEIARQRQMLDYIMRVSAQPPPQ